LQHAHRKRRSGCSFAHAQTDRIRGFRFGCSPLASSFEA
jgi:hypothetical protein